MIWVHNSSFLLELGSESADTPFQNFFQACYVNYIVYVISEFSFNPLTTNAPPAHRNQSIDLQCKSTDWFLYCGEHWSLMGLITAISIFYLLYFKYSQLGKYSHFKILNIEKLFAHYLFPLLWLRTTFLKGSKLNNWRKH